MTERGHSVAELWQCTPRELVGWLYFSNRVKKRRRAEELSVNAMAARGDIKAVKKQIEDAGKG